MDCSEARAGLWPPERPKLVGDEVARARAHVAACLECSEYFELDRSLLDLYDRARDVAAPITVRERVFDAIAGARWWGHRGEVAEAAASPADATDGNERGAGGSRRHSTHLLTSLREQLVRYGAWPTAVAAVLVVFLIQGRANERRAAVERSDVFVEDYLRRAVGEDRIVSNDPGAVTKFLERELGMRVEPLRLAGFDLSRAEICLLEGRRGAMIVYQQDDKEVTHYVVPRDDAVERRPALSTTENRTTGVETPVVTWSTPDVEQALVGEVAAELLLALAGGSASDS